MIFHSHHPQKTRSGGGMASGLEIGLRDAIGRPAARLEVGTR